MQQSQFILSLQEHIWAHFPFQYEMGKSSGHTLIAKDQIEQCICSSCLGTSLSVYEIIGYCRLYKKRPPAREECSPEIAFFHNMK